MNGVVIRFEGMRRIRILRQKKKTDCIYLTLVFRKRKLLIDLFRWCWPTTFSLFSPTLFSVCLFISVHPPPPPPPLVPPWYIRKKEKEEKEIERGEERNGKFFIVDCSATTCMCSVSFFGGRGLWSLYVLFFYLADFLANLPTPAPPTISPAPTYTPFCWYRHKKGYKWD